MESYPSNPIHLAMIGTRIGDARRRLKITKAELARRIGQPGREGWRLVHRWENGVLLPEPSDLIRLAHALNISFGPSCSACGRPFHDDHNPIPLVN